MSLFYYGYKNQESQGARDTPTLQIVHIFRIDPR